MRWERIGTNMWIKWGVHQHIWIRSCWWLLETAIEVPRYVHRSTLRVGWWRDGERPERGERLSAERLVTQLFPRRTYLSVPVSSFNASAMGVSDE